MADTTAAPNPIPQLFTEAFRPKDLSQIIILPRVRQEVEKGLVDNLLFAGTPGTGKTTISRIMGAFGSDPLIINASMYRGIDIIREKIMSYATASCLFDGADKKKVVILEECDNLTFDAWSALRATIEQFHATVRFIANCNYIEKIPEPIQSRFNCIFLEPQNNEEEEYLVAEYIKRVALILNACKISYTEDVLVKFVKDGFPDMRSLIKKIQQLYTRGVTQITPETLGSSFDCSSLFNLILSAPNPWENYKQLVANWASKPEDAIAQLGKEFPDYLSTVAPQKLNKLPLVVIDIAEYSAQLPSAIDKFVVFLALVYKLQMTLSA